MAFVHGFCLALGLILPLGVQNLFVFQQGMAQPRLRGALPVIITAALCDTALIMLAVGGISVLFVKFAVVKQAMIIGGACMLFYMGYVNWQSSPSDEATHDQSALSPKRQVMFAVSVSILNPYALLDIIGVIGTSSLQYYGEEKIIFMLSCILVSWCWFLGLGIVGRWFGSLPDFGEKMVIINKISSIFIWGTGLFLLYNMA